MKIRSLNPIQIPSLEKLYNLGRKQTKFQSKSLKKKSKKKNNLRKKLKLMMKMQGKNILFKS